jgi:hypothetical protein
MTIAQIAQYCTETVGDVSSEALSYAKRAIRLKYLTLYDAHAWRESMRVLEAVPVDPTLKGIIFLPFDAEEVIFMSISRDGLSYRRLIYRERDWIERTVAPTFSLPGNIPWFYRAENLAWPYLSPGKFTFTTSDSSPFTVYIEGRDANDHPVNESFILNASVNPDGTVTPMSVQSANSYSLVTSLSKTGGTLSVRDAATSRQIIMQTGSPDLVFTQLVLYPPPLFVQSDGSPYPVYVRLQVKLKADSLDNDMSVPRISHIWDALIEYTLSALYTRARQLTKANDREQKAIAHVQAAVNVEKNQSEHRQQAYPTIYEQADYLGRGDVVSSAVPFG